MWEKKVQSMDIIKIRIKNDINSKEVSGKIKDTFKKDCTSYMKYVSLMKFSILINVNLLHHCVTSCPQYGK